jgi:hypothetical protein
MGEVPFLEKQTDSIDALASSLKLGLILGSPEARHHIELSQPKARELVRIIETRDQVRIVKVEAAPPIWWFYFVGATLLATASGDAALAVAGWLQ